MDPIKVLVSLFRGYGLGDAVQMSVVLQHIKKYRPHWRVDFQAEEGRECIGRGLCEHTFNYGQLYPSTNYDAEAQILLFDTISNYSDRPNTRAVSCLQERFDLQWDRECSRYKLPVSEKADKAAQVLTKPKWEKGVPQKTTDQVVALHYKGDSAPSRKDLTHNQAAAICHSIEHLRTTPLLIDWRDTSPLVNSLNLRTTGRTPTSKQWGADAEMNCAVISRCMAFIGIDSGPAKCASATNTPSLVVWTGHHPAIFHDPASNTTHLVPEGYKGLYPQIEDKSVIEWFEANYKVRFYTSDPVRQVTSWLEETLSEKPSLRPTLADKRESKARSNHRRLDGRRMDTRPH